MGPKRRITMESKVSILTFQFNQTEHSDEIDAFQSKIPSTEFCSLSDNNILENQQFEYYVFTPSSAKTYNRSIVMLHGLNERSWDKYKQWAEDLAINCGRPVILFPIAFHINRTPKTWSSPRWIMPWLDRRKEQVLDSTNSTFANLALSSRISNSPLRFYTSGRESAFNLIQLTHEIVSGRHPLFSEGTQVDFFAYSIGALLAEVVLIANPDNIFNNSKLFSFCGGSVFEMMNGNAKDILDKEAFSDLKAYYTDEFINDSHHRQYPGLFESDDLEMAFKTMILKDTFREKRVSFFNSAKERIKIITLKKDVVIPTKGAIEAVGRRLKTKIVEELDFPFNYSHQIPFPENNKISALDRIRSFRMVFDRAAAFLI